MNPERLNHNDEITVTFSGNPINVEFEFRDIFGFNTPANHTLEVNDDGFFSFTGIYELDAPDLTIQSIVQDPDSSTAVDWEKSVTFTVTIVDDGGNPISGAFVEVADTVMDGTFQSGESDGNGVVTYTTTVPSQTSDATYTLDFVAMRANANDSGVFPRQVIVSSHIISLSGDLDFGDVVIDDAAQRTLSINNEGSSAINISGITYPSTAYGGSFIGTVFPMSTQNIVITFFPDSESAFGGEVEVGTVETVTGNTTIAISGNGVPEAIFPLETVTATKADFGFKIVISWSRVDEITEYEIFRSTGDNPETAALISTRNETGTEDPIVFDDLSIEVGTLYYYWIKSKLDDQRSEFSIPDFGFALAAPQSVEASDGVFVDKVVLNWPLSFGADSYDVFRNTENDQEAATLVGNTTELTFPDTTAVPGTTYFYWIKTVKVGFSTDFSFNDTGFAFATPQNIVASDGEFFDRVNVAWDFVQGAQSYMIFRHTSDESAEATQIAVIPGTRFQDMTAEPGLVYFYWVNAINSQNTTTDFSRSDAGFISNPQSLNDGLMVFFPFNGNANDEGDLGLDSTLSGASLTSDRFGKSDSAYNFDGIDDFIELPVNSLSILVGRYIISAWIKTTATPETLGPIYSGKHDFLGSQFGGFQISIESEGKIDSENYTAPIVSFGGVTTTPINDGAWHQVVGTWDGTEYRVYVDGTRKLVGQATFAGQISWLASIESMFIGKNLEEEYYQGTIDDLRLYNRALSSEEITDLRAATTGEAAALRVAGNASFVNEGTEFQGNFYNGFELQGATGVFSSNAGEITRISFLDPSGDLVFAEFGSDDPDTTLLISLRNHVAAVPSPYNQPGTTYEQGLADFSINNSNEATFFSVFTLGNDPSRVDTGLIQSDTLSGSVDGIADVGKISVAVNSQLSARGAKTRIGGINAANANFTDSERIVGIDAEEISVDLFLFLGDITPSGEATPWLRIDPSSSISEILIAGGDLREATGPMQIDTNGIVYPFSIRASDGQRSISNSAFRPDLGDGKIPPASDTFVADTDAYFLTDGQSTGPAEATASSAQADSMAESRETMGAASLLSTSRPTVPQPYSKPQHNVPADPSATSVANLQGMSSRLPSSGVREGWQESQDMFPPGAYSNDLQFRGILRTLFRGSSGNRNEVAEGGGIWLWVPDLGWIWTSPTHFPLFWRSSADQWVVFELDEDTTQVMPYDRPGRGITKLNR